MNPLGILKPEPTISDDDIEKGLASVWKTGKSVEVHGVEIAREAARGAMHVVAGKPF